MALVFPASAALAYRSGDWDTNRSTACAEYPSQKKMSPTTALISLVTVLALSMKQVWSRRRTVRTQSHRPDVWLMKARSGQDLSLKRANSEIFTCEVCQVICEIHQFVFIVSFLTCCCSSFTHWRFVFSQICMGCFPVLFARTFVFGLRTK